MLALKEGTWLANCPKTATATVAEGNHSEGVESRSSVCAFSEVLWLPTAVEGSCCTTTSWALNLHCRHAPCRGPCVVQRM